VDLAVPDVAAAAAFYREVFGWRPEPVPGAAGYEVMQAGGGAVCGVYAMGAERRAAGDPPAWLLYLTVDDADARAGRALALGATPVADPYDVPGAGRAAVIADPTGARVALWQGGAMAGAAVVAEPGALTWSELATTDRRAAAAFYTALLELRAEDMEGPFPYTTLVGGEGPVAGVYEPGDGPSRWTPYFAVQDAEAAAGLAVAGGGRVLQDPLETPYGRIGVIADPVGAVVAIVQLPA